MRDGFYRAFEERWRGSRELIKSRLRFYLPVVKPLIHLRPDAKAIDIGCGRGEWLELLTEIGLDAQGVDLDDGMLAACRQLGLNVQTQDAIDFLKALPDASQVVVSGFHIVEHIPFDELQQLVQQALRVLAPGGLLILETPNPENIVVATSSFYLDPSHQRPIPSQLLVFLLEHYGFAKVVKIGLNEQSSNASREKPTLLDVLNGVSPDYAVLAQKEGAPEHMQTLAERLALTTGLSIDALATKFEDRLARGEQAQDTWEKFKATPAGKLLSWLNEKLTK